MAGLMNWDAYRQQAGQQTANLNASPFVLDPAAMTSDPAANRALLYGNDKNPTGGPSANAADNPAAMRKAIGTAFQQFFGRPASEQDYAAWMSGAQAGGLSPDAVAAGIAEAAGNPINAGIKGAGFSGGLMANGAGFNGLAG